MPSEPEGRPPAAPPPPPPPPPPAPPPSGPPAPPPPGADWSPEPAVDLRSPRRTSALGIAVAVLDLDQLRSLVPLAVLLAASGRLAILAGFVVVVVPLIALAGWWRRRWWVADGVIHIDEGIITRSERRIPLDRIQHIEIEAQAVDRLFGLTRIRVETAGGSGAEFELAAIARAEADAVRDAARAHRPAAAGAAEQDAGVAPAEFATADAAASAGTTPTVDPFRLTLRARRLLLAGVTGPEIALVAGGLFYLADLLSDVGVDVGDRGPTSLVVTLALVASVPVLLALAAVVGLVRHWGFTLTHDGTEFRVSYGLLSRRETTLPAARVQVVRIHRRLLLRPFGRADLRLSSAATGSGEQSRIDIPLLSPSEIEAVIGRAVPDAVPLPPLVAPPTVARRRAIWRALRVGVPLAAIVLLVAVGTGLWAVAALGVALVPAAVLHGVLAYRGLGYAAPAAVLHSQTGVYSRTHHVVPAARVQTTRTRSTWFQRRVGLHDLTLDLAGAAITIPERPDPVSGL